MPDNYDYGQFARSVHGGAPEPYPPPSADERRLTTILERLEIRMSRIEKLLERMSLGNSG